MRFICKRFIQHKDNIQNQIIITLRYIFGIRSFCFYLHCSQVVTLKPFKRGRCCLLSEIPFLSLNLHDILTIASIQFIRQTQFCDKYFYLNILHNCTKSLNSKTGKPSLLVSKTNI